MLTIFDRIITNAKLLGLIAVLVVLGLAGGSVLTYRHERDTARASLAQAQSDLARSLEDNKSLAGSLAAQNAAVAKLAADAKIREYAAAKADADAQAAQSKYTLLAGKIQAQVPGADQCASLHSLRSAWSEQ